MATRARRDWFSGRARPVVVLLLLSTAAAAPAEPPVKTYISYRDGRPVLDALPDNLPRELNGKTRSEIEASWLHWISRRDGEIRARLDRGDEDSIVNLWLFGTSFTTLPPARDRDLTRFANSLTPADVVDRRLADIVSGIASPGPNERLQFARQVVERHGIDPTTAIGRQRTRLYLIEVRNRALGEFKAYDREVRDADGAAGTEFGAHSSMFRDRGLSSDTSLLPAFGVEKALEAIRGQGLLSIGSVRRAAIIGPGLDYINKADGYDFYPQQTVQPFAFIDSLKRLGLAAADLRITTFDLSPRINHHLEAALAHARTGDGYRLQLPLDIEEHWTSALVAYWQRLGQTIGEQAESTRPPDAATTLQVRSVRVRPDVVLSITPRDLNIVVERLAALPPEERFDVVIATNIIVYYDLFEQSLALANVAAMLRPGGLFISNDAVLPTPPMKSSAGYTTVSYSDRQLDQMLWYQRQ
jgi:hypothetical protein